MPPYAVGYEADFVEKRSRLTTFFRYIMAIPLYLVAIVYGIGAFFTIIIAWFAMLFTGRYPEGLYAFNGGVIRFMTRLNAYTWLLTDQYPPFDTAEHPEYPIRVPIAPAQESYSRVKVFFRPLLAIPVMLIAYAMNLLAGICAFLAWFYIVILGRQSQGLQDATNLGASYIAKASAYYFLLTETYPPFGQGQQDAGQPAASA